MSSRPHQRARRANVVDRRGSLLALGCGVPAALVVLAAEPAPTGIVWWDSVLVALGVCVVVWAGASVPWWVLLVVSAMVGVMVGVWWAVVIVVAAAALAMYLSVRRASWAPARAAAVASLLAAGAHNGHQWFHGATALLVVGAAVLVVISGVSRRLPDVRRRVWRAAGVGAGIGTVAMGAVALALLAARDDFREGERLARQGLNQAQRGDIDGAAATLRQASVAFERADNVVGSPWLRGAGFVPVLSQQQRTLAEVSRAGGDATTAAASALDRIDIERLRLDEGSFDLDAIRDLSAPFADLAAAVDGLQHRLTDVENSWLIAPVQQRLADVGAELERQSRLLGNASTTVRLAPSLLGADTPRRYFVAFVTPAEARGLVGFMGNWAEITVEGGRIELTAFGTDEDLNRGGDDPEGRRITGPPEFVELYGQFGLVESDGTTGRVPWKNITMPPDLTTVAPVIAELYPQSGGSPIDGVFVVDPAGIAALMRFSGPVRVEGLNRPLTAANVEQFILKDQYLSMQGRTDRLDAIARAVVANVLDASLPEPTRLARTFGPLVPDRSVMAWSAHEEEQALFEALGMHGTLAAWMGEGDAVIARNNGGANKIDIYVTEEWEPTAQGGRVTFTNTAPAAGLPEYVIGNKVGLRMGTSRTRYTLYTRQQVSSLTVNGTDHPASVAIEQGMIAYSFVVDLAAGEQFVLEWQLA